MKICGITRVEDAIAAVDAGADAIGLNFYSGSKRVVSLDLANRIIDVIPPFVSVVGLFVNHTQAEVTTILSQVRLDLLQFHGDETAEFCSSFQRSWLKAVRMKTASDLAAASNSFAQARALLLDAWDANEFGGTGKTFDWSLIGPSVHASRIIVAGGLTPGNVAGAIKQLRPWAVDVSSGVETAPGIKSAALIQSFISEVHSV